MSLLIIFIFGAVFGSFFGVLIERLPKEQSILGRSHCDYCKKTLHGLDLIPIFSFIMTGGRTRCCGKKLSYFYPFLEVLTGMSFIVVWLYSGNTLIEKILYLGIISTLIVIFFADIKYQIIPDSMQVCLLIFAVGLQILHVGNIYSSLVSIIFSGIVVMAPILLLFLATKGRGMGFGDVKLAFGMGVLLGWLGGLVALYFGFIFGAIVGITLFLTGKKKLKSKIAFGPFLVLGILTILLFHDSIFTLIHSIYGV